MEMIYANSFAITTNGENEIYLLFNTNVPNYDNGKYTGMKTEKSFTAILSKDGYNSFRKMIDDAEAKEGKEK